ncbi:MAG TPA: type IA DNA topoisomerase [Saprospiraceae bacterium]|nr:type IA DNA topoisomerase [Saprospiraceae bacterium]
MKVCIAEKPSVAKEIAKILGANSRHEGYFEGNGYQVTWTFGHFCTLYEPNDYKPHWKQWNLNSLPMLPEKFEIKLIDNEGVKKQFAVIKKLFAKAAVVINCGDAGQEGELIQRWVIKHAGYQGQVKRLWISSLTTQAIQQGFQQLKDASDYDNLFYAGTSRAVGDWLLGMNATRLYTLKYGGYKQMLSIGRVQTPTLAMLVKRQQEILNFKPKTYWELHTIYRDTDFSALAGKFTKQEDGQALLEKITAHPFTVTSVTKKKSKEHPPKLFDLTGLQVYCNNKFSLSADQTLKIVQKLYEQKVVTYPRVDTTFLPDDVYPKVQGILTQLSNYSSFTKPLLGKKIRKSRKVFNNSKVTDHHAIIPTGVQKKLFGNEQQVYDIIVRRFIMAFYPDAVVSNSVVIGAVNEVEFKATGKEILEENWRTLLPPSKNNDRKKDAAVLPTFVVGETGPHEPVFMEKQTKPPKYYTEATLLRAMETAGKKVEDEELRELMKENGIGRPSTRANIIETLFRRKYAKRIRKQIHPTDTGVQLIQTISNQLLKSAELTGQWERKLKLIEAGDYSAGAFIREMKKMVDDLVVEVRMENNIKKITASKPSVRPSKPKSTPSSKSINTRIEGQKCPRCQKGKLLKGKTAYGCSEWKSGCNLRIPFSFMSKKISENQIKRLVTKGSTVTLKGFKDGSKKVSGKVVFDKNFQLKLEPIPGTESKTKDTVICPKCKKGTLLKGQTAYGCSRWKDGCDFKFLFEDIYAKAQGRKLTKELVLEIISGDL